MTDIMIKEKIILATITCIEQVGIQNVTIRQIAEKAQVNVAAVNYHFGNKEELLRVVLEQTIEEGFGQNVKDYEELWKTDTLNALRSFLQDTLRGAVEYPNLTKAHMADVFNNNDYSGPTVQRFTKFTVKFYNLIKDILKQRDEVIGKMAVAQMLNSILMVGMMPDLYTSLWNFSLENKENQDRFIDMLINSYCITPKE